MSQFTNFDELNDFVSTFLQNSVSPVFINNRSERLELLKEAVKREKSLLKRHLASDRDENVLQITAGFLKRFEKLVEQLNEECEKHKTPKVICDLAEEIDKSITLPQREDRFQSIPGDGKFQIMAKWGKRILRKFQRGGYRIFNLFGLSNRQPPPWQQEIPLRTIICYAMAADRGRHRKWLQNDLYLYYRILDEYKTAFNSWLEQDTGNLKLTEEQESQLIEKWQQLFDDQLSQIEEKKEGIQTEITEFVADQNDKLKTLLAVAGTIEGAHNSFYSNHSPEVLQQLDEILTAIKDKYVNAQRAYLNEVDVLIDFAGIGNRLLERLHKAETTVEELYQNSALNNVQAVTNDLIQLVDHLPDPKDMDAVRERITASFNKKIIEPLSKESNQDRIQTMAQDFSDDVVLIISELPDVLKVVEIDFGEDDQIEFEEQTYELNKLVARFFKEKTLRPLKNKTEAFGTDLRALAENLQQAKDIVDASLMTATEAYSSGPKSESPKAIAEDGLKRAVDKLEKVTESVPNPFRELTTLLKSTMTDEYSQLLRHIREQTLHELQWKDREYQVRGRAEDWKVQIQVLWAKIEDQLAIWFRFGNKKFKSWFVKIAPWIGYEEMEQGDQKKQYLTTYLSKTEEEINRLPSIYRRLFNAKQIADKKFYQGNPNAVSQFKNAFEAWSDNIHTSFALIGERGSGKTSFAHRIEEEFTSGTEVELISLDKLIYTKKQLLELFADKFELDTVNNVEECIQQLNELPERRVAVVDNLHDMYIRSMEGFEALETFMLIMTQTNDNILWGVTASRYAWCYLDKVLNVSDYFSHLAVCDALDEKQITQLILSRHRASGYELEFVADEDISRSRLYKKHLSERDSLQKYLQKIYFRNLADIAQGNPSVAMSFWLRSIKEFDEQRMVIQPVSYTSLSEIEEISPEILFTLATLILHDNLSVSELALALNVDEYQSQLVLYRLTSKGILMRHDKQFTLNELLYRQTIRYLQQRNVIHLTEV